MYKRQVYDGRGDFSVRRCNRTSVDLEPLVLEADVERVRNLLERHRDYTGSPRAAWMLEHWAAAQPGFIKVFPHEYKRVLGIRRSPAALESGIRNPAPASATTSTPEVLRG